MEHRFNVRFAKDYGIEEAILIENLYFWIAKNVANEKHKYERRYWTYNSAKAFAELFPYINETKIYRVLSHLEDVEFIIKGKFSQDKHDRTNWYSFSDKGLSRLHAEKYDTTNFSETFQNGDMDFTKLQNGTRENANCIIIDNTDKIKTDSNKEEDTNVSPKKNDYQAIFDCWNKYNGKKIRKVTQFTDARKKAIKKMLDIHNISQEVLMRFFASLPFADQWLFHPTGTHKLWKPTFDWWMANTNGWLTKGLEGGVHLENPQAFERIMNSDSFSSTSELYFPQGRDIWFNEDTKSYWSTYNFYDERIYDGYTDEERPDGAEITLNNARGTYKWNSNNKKWEKK